MLSYKQNNIKTNKIKKVGGYMTGNAKDFYERRIYYPSQITDYIWLGGTQFFPAYKYIQPNSRGKKFLEFTQIERIVSILKKENLYLQQNQKNEKIQFNQLTFQKIQIL